MISVRFYTTVFAINAPQMGLTYLKAIHDTNLGVRACPIGALFISPASAALMPLFFGEMPSNHFVNVVCCQPGFSLGFVTRAADVAPGAGAIDGPVAVPGSAPLAAAPSDVIYQPPLAFAGLYTVGIANIAITSPHPQPPDKNEVRALQQYDFVLAPDDADADALRRVGVDALHVPPDSGQLKKILEALLS